MSLGNPRAKIIRDYKLEYPTQETEGAHVGGDPFGQSLGPSGLGVGIVGGAEHGDKDLGLWVFNFERNTQPGPRFPAKKLF
jgi:hypothetical protein